MSSRPQILHEISNILDAEPPFTTRNVTLSERELQKTFDQLRGFKRSKRFKPKGERPKRHTCPSEATTNYRRKMSRYIRSNAGVSIPGTSLVSARFYDNVADYLGL